MAAALGEDRTAVAAALAEFEACGLAFAEDGQWRAAGRGFVFEMPDDPQGQEAARQLANAVLLQYVDLPNRWLEDDEPRLPVDWLRASGAFNARMKLTPDELRELQAGLELLIEPYAHPQGGRHSGRRGLRSHPGVLHAGGIDPVVSGRTPGWASVPECPRRSEAGSDRSR
jgi:hypothetical protein